MIRFTTLTNALVSTFRNIPELVAALDGRPENISGYIDRNPDRNSTAKAIYQMMPGSILVIWQQTLFDASSMQGWNHQFQYYLRAARGGSSQDLMTLLVNGVPVPGDGLCWRFCPVMAGTLPTELPVMERVMDEEGIDYFVITAVTTEVGDQLGD